MKASLTKKYHQIIISPHLDDAVFSCGGLLQTFPGNTLVVTVFSSSEVKHYSRFSKKYLHWCGYSNASSYFYTRKLEDRRAGKILGFDHLHLNFIDGIFRYYQFLLFHRFLYLNTDKLFGHLHSNDFNLISTINQKIIAIIKHKSLPSTRLYFPLSLGHHVDHQIIRHVADLLRPTQLKIYYYEDFPYMFWKQKHQSLKLGLRQEKLSLTKSQLSKKHSAILSYKSQIIPVFHSKREFNQLWQAMERKGYETYWH